MAKILIGSTDRWKIFSELKWFKVTDRYLANKFGKKIQSITEEDFKEYNVHGSVEQIAYNVYERCLENLKKELERYRLGKDSTYCGNTLIVHIGNETIRIAASHEEAKSLLARNSFPFLYDHNIKAEEEKYGIKEYKYVALSTRIDSYYVGHDKNKTRAELI